MTDKKDLFLKVLEEAKKDKDERDMNSFTLSDLIRVEHYCRQEYEKFKTITSDWNTLYDLMSIHVVPTKMEDEEVESQKVAGVGRVNLRSDMFTQTLDQEGLAEWLRDNEMEDLLKETVHGGTLKATIKEQMKKKGGKVPPESLVKVTPYTRAVITKG